MIFLFMQMKSTSPLCVLLLLEVVNFFQVDGGLKDRVDFRQAVWSSPKIREVQQSVWSSGGTLRAAESDYPNLLIDTLKDFGDSYRDHAGFRFLVGPGYAVEKSLKGMLGKQGKMRRASPQTEKRTDDLENLAEGLNGYRSKGGFTFRFG
uniref:Uncharacterized protein n=1 Tax=Paramormyrops kingsleyae TaxID=1676925 RepID=A0A3B3RYM1_9TELE